MNTIGGSNNNFETKTVKKKYCHYISVNVAKRNPLNKHMTFHHIVHLNILLHEIKSAAGQIFANKSI